MKQLAYPTKMPAGEPKASGLLGLLSEGFQDDIRAEREARHKTALEKARKELEAALAEINVDIDDVLSDACDLIQRAADNSDAEPMTNYQSWGDEEDWDGGPADFEVDDEVNEFVQLIARGRASVEGYEPSTYDYPGYGGDTYVDLKSAVLVIYDEDGEVVANVDAKDLLADWGQFSY